MCSFITVRLYRPSEITCTRTKVRLYWPVEYVCFYNTDPHLQNACFYSISILMADFNNAYTYHIVQADTFTHGLQALNSYYQHSDSGLSHSGMGAGQLFSEEQRGRSQVDLSPSNLARSRSIESYFFVAAVRQHGGLFGTVQRNQE